MQHQSAAQALVSRMSLSLFSSISTISIFPLRFLFTTVDKLSTHCSSAARLTTVPCSTKKHVSLDRESAPRKSSSRRVDAMHDSVSRTLPRHVPLIDVFIRNSIKLYTECSRSRADLSRLVSLSREFACEGCATFGAKFHALFSRLIV